MVPVAWHQRLRCGRRRQSPGPRAHDPRVSYDQLTTGAEDASTAGSLIGDYQGVRDAVKDGLLSMLTGGLSPRAALDKAQREADAAIKSYNDRLGVG